MAFFWEGRGLGTTDICVQGVVLPPILDVVAGSECIEACVVLHSPRVYLHCIGFRMPKPMVIIRADLGRCNVLQKKIR